MRNRSMQPWEMEVWEDWQPASWILSHRLTILLGDMVSDMTTESLSKLSKTVFKFRFQIIG